MKPTPAPKHYLIVEQILANTEEPGRTVWDRANDPETRTEFTEAMSFGICRPQVRKGATVGSRLFVIKRFADPKQDEAGERYYYSEMLTVGSIISHYEAARRFPQRRNTLVEPLPMNAAEPFGRTMWRYIEQHIDKLEWKAKSGRQLKRELRKALEAGTEAAKDAKATEVMDNMTWVDIPGRGGIAYVHGYWDEHADWATRVKQPYLVGDIWHCYTLRPPKAWRNLTELCPELPKVEELNAGGVGGGIHPVRLVRPESDAFYFLMEQAHPHRIGF